MNYKYLKLNKKLLSIKAKNIYLFNTKFYKPILLLIPLLFSYINNYGQGSCGSGASTGVTYSGCFAGTQAEFCGSSATVNWNRTILATCYYAGCTIEYQIMMTGPTTYESSWTTGTSLSITLTTHGRYTSYIRARAVGFSSYCEHVLPGITYFYPQNGTGTIQAAPSDPVVGQGVSFFAFHNNTSDPQTDYDNLYWTFSNGVPSTFASCCINQSRSFSSSGTQTITISGKYRTCDWSASTTINVLPCSSVDPVITKSVNNCKNQTTTFTCSNAGSNSTYTWDFGSGATPSTATGRGPHSVVYNTSGNKTASVTVKKSVCPNVIKSTNFYIFDSLITSGLKINTLDTVPSHKVNNLILTTIDTNYTYNWSVISPNTITNVNDTGKAIFNNTGNQIVAVQILPGTCPSYTIDTILYVEDCNLNGRVSFNSYTCPAINLDTTNQINFSITDPKLNTTYNWDFGTNAIPSTAIGIGVHQIKYALNRTLSPSIQNFTVTANHRLCGDFTFSAPININTHALNVSAGLIDSTIFTGYTPFPYEAHHIKSGGSNLSGVPVSYTWVINNSKTLSGATTLTGINNTDPKISVYPPPITNAGVYFVARKMTNGNCLEMVSNWKQLIVDNCVSGNTIKFSERPLNSAYKPYTKIGTPNIRINRIGTNTTGLVNRSNNAMSMYSPYSNTNDTFLYVATELPSVGAVGSYSRFKIAFNSKINRINFGVRGFYPGDQVTVKAYMGSVITNFSTTEDKSWWLKDSANTLITQTSPGVYVSSNYTFKPQSTQPTKSPHTDVYFYFEKANMDSIWIEVKKNLSTGVGLFGFTDIKTCGIAPLPVELMYFEGKKINNQVLLNWKTASEINNDYFELYKSIDNGQSFSKIAQIDGNGSTNMINSYHFTDYEYSQKDIFYKLIQYDFDGKFEEFNPIMVSSIKNKNTAKVHIIPNPSTDMINLFFENINPNQIKIYDYAGTIVYQSTKLNIENIDISSFPNGLFIVEVEDTLGKKTFNKLCKK